MRSPLLLPAVFALTGCADLIGLEEAVVTSPSSAAVGGAAATSTGTAGTGGGSAGAGAGGCGADVCAAPGAPIWGAALGSSLDDNVHGLVVNSDGSMGLAGAHPASLSLPGAPPLDNAGMDDAFIVRIAEGPTTKWSMVLSSPGKDIALAATHTSKDDMLVVGSFGGDVALQPTGMLTHQGGSDAFVLLIPVEGGVEASRALGAIGYQVAHAVAVSPAGAAVGGVYSNAIVLGGAGAVELPDADNDGFVAFFAGGRAVWARALGGPDVIAEVQGLAMDAQNNDVIAVGNAMGTLDLPSGPFTTAEKDILVVRLAQSDGSVLAAVASGGPGEQEVHGVAVNAAGTVVTCGEFTGGLSAGMTTELVGAGLRDAFVLALAPGSVDEPLWARRFGGPGQDAATAIAFDDDGRLFVVGTVTDDARGVGLPLDGKGGTDAFVAELDPATGEPIWARALGGPADDRGRALAIGPGGTLGVAGLFKGEIDLGVGAWTSQGQLDVFGVVISR